MRQIRRGSMLEAGRRCAGEEGANTGMEEFCCDPLALTTTVNTLSVALARQLDDDALALLAALFTQVGDTLATIAVQRQLCRKEEPAV